MKNMDHKKIIRALKEKGDFDSVRGKESTIRNFANREEKKTGNKYKVSHQFDDLFIVSLVKTK